MHTPSFIKSYIRNVFEDASQVNERLLLYYTGHGNTRSGDWQINPSKWIDMSSLHKIIEDAVAVIRLDNRSDNLTLRKPREVLIVCDCCYAGHWTEKLMRNGRDFPLFKGIVASCDKNKPGRGNYFGMAIWGDSTTTYQRAWKDFLEMKPPDYQIEMSDLQLLKKNHILKKLKNYNRKMNLFHQCLQHGESRPIPLPSDNCLSLPFQCRTMNTHDIPLWTLPDVALPSTLSVTRV